ncbi:MAG: hypothetical protein ACYS30_15905 [Planctomycetota bacterium]|jgi:hypothetical protein
MIRFTLPKRVKILIIIGLLLTIFPLIAESAIYNSAIIEKADSADSILSKIIFYPLAIIHLGLLIFLYFSYPIGTAILLSVGVLWFFSEQFSSENNMRKCTYSAILLPVSGNLYLFIQALPFLRYPTGTAIRPMGWVSIMFVISIAITVISLIWTIKSIKQNKNIIFGVLGAMFSLLPLLTAVFSFHLIVNIKGLILKE